MYWSESPRVPPSSPGAWKVRWPRVAPNVWLLGVTSLLTDISSEMVVAVLPAYLVLQLQLSPLAFGTLDGVYNGVTAFTRWASGPIADRWRRHKEVAAAGYLLSAFCKLALILAGRQVAALGAVIAADRLGKGLRTVPRDALISLSAPPAHVGSAFGVHRSLDAAGALLGPIVALVVLGFVPGGYDVVFVISFAVALIGAGVLIAFVQNARPAAGALDVAAGSGSRPLAPAQRRALMLLTIAASALALTTISDAFVYLSLHERFQFSATMFPLLAAGTAVSFLALAVPAGWLADRWGRIQVFLAGHAFLLAVYALIVAGPFTAAPLVAVVALGAYYAATDGVLMACASSVLPEARRGSGLAILTTAVAAARFAGAIAFGWMWTAHGSTVAIVAFAVTLAGTLPAAAMALHRSGERSHV